MSSRELIESLRAAGVDKLRLLKQEAEQEAEACRNAACRKLEDLRALHERRLAAAIAQDERCAYADAGNRARALKLASEERLSGRLMSIARSCLVRLRDAGYPAVFEKLALELPRLAWSKVRVRPADAELARRYFPDAEIILEETIIGGLEAATADERLRVVNTFEKRLERAWEDLLPLLVAEVRREATDGASPKPR